MAVVPSPGASICNRGKDGPRLHRGAGSAGQLLSLLQVAYDRVTHVVWARDVRGDDLCLRPSCRLDADRSVAQQLAEKTVADAHVLDLPQRDGALMLVEQSRLPGDAPVRHGHGCGGPPKQVESYFRYFASAPFRKDDWIKFSNRLKNNIPLEINLMTYSLIHNGTLIDGTGRPPLPDAGVLVKDDRIHSVGAMNALPQPDGRIVEVDVQGGFILPGFIDTHVHLMFEGFDLQERLAKPFSLRFFEAILHMRRTLEAGITSVRDAGGADLGVKRM